MVGHELLFAGDNISRCSFWRLRLVIATEFERSNHVQSSTQQREKGISH